MHPKQHVTKYLKPVALLLAVLLTMGLGQATDATHAAPNEASETPELVTVHEVETVAGPVEDVSATLDGACRPIC